MECIASALVWSSAPEPISIPGMSCMSMPGMFAPAPACAWPCGAEPWACCDAAFAFVCGVCPARALSQAPAKISRLATANAAAFRTIVVLLLVYCTLPRAQRFRRSLGRASLSRFPSRARISPVPTETVTPARAIRGAVEVPGDKSISHRYAILAALARGRSEIEGYSAAADCASTLGCVERLGIPVERETRGGSLRLTIVGTGLGGLRRSAQPLDAGNSGTTMRL